MMDSNKTIVIPIATHLKKFLIKFYNIKDAEAPVFVGTTSTIGIIMATAMQDHRKPRRREFKERITFVLSSDLSDLSARYGNYVKFSVYFTRIFIEQLYGWVQAQELADISAYNSVQLFLDHYKIKEKEYSFDSAYRAYSRHKNNEYKRIQKRREEKRLLKIDHPDALA